MRKIQGFKIFRKYFFFKFIKKFKKKRSFIFGCYSIQIFPHLINHYIRFGKFPDIFLGTIAFNCYKTKNYPNIPISEIEQLEYLSCYFVQIANRRNKKILQINHSHLLNLYDQEQVYLNTRYIISLIDLAIKNNSKESFNFICPSSGNKIVNELIKRYYYKNNSIKIKISYLSKIIKPSKDLFFIYKKPKFNKSSFFKPFSNKNDYKFRKNINIAFIHHKDSSLNKPYIFLSKQLSKINNFISLEYTDFYQLSNLKKPKILLYAIRYLFRIILKNHFKIIHYGLFAEIIQLTANYIYYLSCINALKNFKFKTIICSYISIIHENILYKACEETNTKTIFYDYSMGYPVKKDFEGRTQYDIIRNPDYIITFGEQRCNQYKLVFSSENKKKPILINGICPQVQFAQIHSKNKSFEEIGDLKYYQSNIIKCSIFDNVYGYNFHITENDIKTCIKTLEKANLEKIILAHYKKEGFLNNYLENSKLIYINQRKGDFTNSFYSDFIISLGFQGSAIKSAFAFKKPMIFFTENNLFFQGSNFFFDDKKNKRIINLLSELTFNQEKLLSVLSTYNEYNKFFREINYYSEILFNEFGLNNYIDNTEQIIKKIINNKF